jgi:protein TonB
MFHPAPPLAAGPRAGVLASVAAAHLALAAGLLFLMPSVRERLVSAAPLFVEYRPAAQSAPPPVPLAVVRPALREPVAVSVAMPAIAVTPEITVVALTRPAPTIMASAAPALAPAADPPVEAPRYELAYLNNPAPAYPPLARRAKEQGRVVLRVLVSASGTAQDVEVRTSSGYERLDRAAVEAVRRWRFVPARRGGETIPAWALVPVSFQLDA